MKIITKGCRSLILFKYCLIIHPNFNQYFLFFGFQQPASSYWHFGFFLAIIYCKASNIQAGISSIYFRYLTETLLPQWSFTCLNPGRDKRSNLIPQLCCMGRGQRGTSEDLQKVTALSEALRVPPSFHWLQWTHSASGQSQPAARALISSWKLIWNTHNTLSTYDPASLSLLQDWH